MIDSELFPEDASSARGLRLFCFPHAGGGTSQFYRWRRYSAESVAIVPARLPGRESRLQQPPITSITEMATNVADTIGSLPPGPFALLGYSVGAYLAYQVACRLPRHGEQAPQAMVAVASNGPATRQAAAASNQSKPRVSDLPDEEFVNHIQNKYGGIPALVRQDPNWLAAVIPALRADLRMLESQRSEQVEPLACPLLAIGGSDDSHVPLDGLASWGAITRGKLTIRQFPGSHFFLYPEFNLSRQGASGKPGDNVPAPLATVFQFVQHGKVSSE